MSVTKKRKFVIGKLEVRSLSVTDILWLSLLCICTIVHLFLQYYCPCKDFGFRFFVVWFTGFQTISSPIGLRFRSVYFSVIWIIFCMLLIDWNILYIYVPLLTFLLYHILRLIFFKKYNREFIPYNVGRGVMWRHTSEIEKASSKLEDKPFSKALLSIGMIIILSTIFSINKQLPLKNLPCGICEGPIINKTG